MAPAVALRYSDSMMAYVVMTTSAVRRSLTVVDRFSPWYTLTLNAPSAVNREISICHCRKAIVGTTTRVDALGILRGSEPCRTSEASHMARWALAASLVASFSGRLSRINAIAWIVLPMPISSAKMPPCTSTCSWFDIHPNPSFWYGSNGMSRSLGGSFGVDHALRTSSSGSMATSSRSSSPALAVTRSCSWACCSADRSFHPSMVDASVKFLKIVHPRCCHFVSKPNRVSVCNPTRTVLLGMAVSHFLHIARPDLEISVQYTMVSVRGPTFWDFGTDDAITSALQLPLRGMSRCWP